MFALQGDLSQEDNPEEISALIKHPAFSDGFDVASINMAAHRIEDPGIVLGRLVNSLKPGGVLFVIDMLAYELPHVWGGRRRSYAHRFVRDSKGYHDGTSFHPYFDGKDQGDAALPTHPIAHHGFSRAKVNELFEEAGAGKDFAMEIVDSIKLARAGPSKRSIFFARGTKA